MIFKNWEKIREITNNKMFISIIMLIRHLEKNPLTNNFWNKEIHKLISKLSVAPYINIRDLYIILYVNHEEIIVPFDKKINIFYHQRQFYSFKFTGLFASSSLIANGSNY